MYQDEEVRLLKDQNAALQEQIISLSVAEDLTEVTRGVVCRIWKSGSGILKAQL